MGLKGIVFLLLVSLFTACGGGSKNANTDVSNPDTVAADTAFQNSDWSNATLGTLDDSIALEMAKAFFDDDNGFVLGKKLDILVTNKNLKTTHPVSYVSKGLLFGMATISGTSYFNDAVVSVEPTYPKVSAKSGTIDFLNYSNVANLKINGKASLSSNLVNVDLNTLAYDEDISGAVSILFKNLAYNLALSFVVTGKEISSVDFLKTTYTYHIVYSFTDSKGKKYSSAFDYIKTKAISENDKLQAEALSAYKSSLWSTTTIGVLDSFNAPELTKAFLTGGSNADFIFRKKLKGLLKNELKKSTKIINSINNGILSGSATITGNTYNDEDVAINPTYPKVAVKSENIICLNYSEDANLKINGTTVYASSTIDIDTDNRTYSKVLHGAVSFLYKGTAYNLVFKWVVTGNEILNGVPVTTTDAYNVDFTYTDTNGKSITGTETITF